MRLYHGSNIVIDSINLAMCRPYKDFGLETTEECAKFVMNNRNRTFTNMIWLYNLLRMIIWHYYFVSMKMKLLILKPY